MRRAQLRTANSQSQSTSSRPPGRVGNVRSALVQEDDQCRHSQLQRGEERAGNVRSPGRGLPRQPPRLRLRDHLRRRLFDGPDPPPDPAAGLRGPPRQGDLQRPQLRLPPQRVLRAVLRQGRRHLHAVRRSAGPAREPPRIRATMGVREESRRRPATVQRRGLADDLLPLPLLQAHRLVRRLLADRPLHRLRALRPRVRRHPQGYRRHPALLQGGGLRIRDRPRHRPIRPGPERARKVQFQFPPQLRLRHAGDHVVDEAPHAPGHLHRGPRGRRLPGDSDLRLRQQDRQLEQLRRGRGLDGDRHLLPGVHPALLHRDPGRVHPQHQREDHPQAPGRRGGADQLRRRITRKRAARR